MKLYQFAYSPFAAKVRKCLELKGIAYETVEVPWWRRRQGMAAIAGAAAVVIAAGTADALAGSSGDGSPRDLGRRPRGAGTCPRG